jgi:hypothetical protein
VSALRRNTVIAAGAFGLAMVVGLVAQRRDAARTAPAEQQAKPVAVQSRLSEGATKGSSAYPQIAAPAPGVDSTAAKPVIINVVTPWIQIARMPQYVQASSAERKAIRDLYWHTCVAEQIPVAQRTSAYWQFVLDWESTESPREEQAWAPSPVDAGTMSRWCKS